MGYIKTTQEWQTRDICQVAVSHRYGFSFPNFWWPWLETLTPLLVLTFKGSVQRLQFWAKWLMKYSLDMALENVGSVLRNYAWCQGSSFRINWEMRGGIFCMWRVLFSWPLDNELTFGGCTTVLLIFKVEGGNAREVKQAKELGIIWPFDCYNCSSYRRSVRGHEKYKGLELWSEPATWHELLLLYILFGSGQKVPAHFEWVDLFHHGVQFSLEEVVLYSAAHTAIKYRP